MRTFNRIGIAILAGLALAASACVAITSPAEAQPLSTVLTLGAQSTPVLSDAQLAQLSEANDYHYTQATRPTEVQVVSGDTVSTIADTAPAIIAAAIMAILYRLVGPFSAILKIARADQIIERYAKGVIDEWLDQNPNWRSQGITLDVKSQWAAQIMNLVVAYAPGWLIKFLGGKEAILQKVKNRLPDVLKDAFPAVFEAHRGGTP